MDLLQSLNELITIMAGNAIYQKEKRIPDCVSINQNIKLLMLCYFLSRTTSI